MFSIHTFFIPLFRMRMRTWLATLSICSQALLLIPFGDISAALPEYEPLNIPAAEAQSCVNTVALGSPFQHTPTYDSQTDENGNAVSRSAGGTFQCPAGQVITSIAYLGIEAGNDSTDGITIACSPLNSNGTLGAQGSYFVNSDLTSNSRYPGNLVQPVCTSGNAVVTVYYNDILDAGREDILRRTQYFSEVPVGLRSEIRQILLSYVYVGRAA